MVEANQNNLEGPKDLPGILQKHADLRADATQPKRGRGRPRKDGSTSSAISRADVREPDGIPLFSADTVRPFIELPYMLGSVWFQSDTLLLEEREAQTLASQGASLANLYAPGWNPKAVALVSFSLAFLTISTSKILALIGERAARKKALEQNK